MDCTLSAPKRGEILYRAAQIMLRRKDDLAREMTLEMGKVLAESRGDVQEGIGITYYIAERDAAVRADWCRPSSRTVGDEQRHPHG